MWTRNEMAVLAAAELREGDYVNLGIGIPTLIANNIPNSLTITLQSENGLLGMGPFPLDGKEDADLINAGKQTVTILSGGSIFDSAESFAMIRGGHIDIAFLGAMQVSSHGDLANWSVPGQLVKGMGGAMDLVAGTRRIVVLTDHSTKTGQPKVVEHCTLPLTGVGVVRRIITNLADFEVVPDGLLLRRLAPGVTEADVYERTEADFIVDLIAEVTQ